LEEGVKDDGKDSRPDDRREKREENFIEEINGKKDEKKKKGKKNLFFFQFLPTSQHLSQRGKCPLEIGYPFERIRRIGVSARARTL